MSVVRSVAVSTLRTIRAQRLGTLVVALVVAFAAVACTSTDKVVPPVAPIPPDTTPTPPTPVDTVTLDLRFKGVGTLSSDSSLLISNIDCGPGANHTVGSCLSSFSLKDNESGTPLELADGDCVAGVAGDCSWFFETFSLGAHTIGLNVIYHPDVLTNLAAALDSVPATDTVVTSLDIEPGNLVFAVAEYVARVNGGYNRAHHVVALSGLQAAATQVGAAGRVITAVSFDSGQVHYLSYSWKQAPSAVYEARVDTATFATLGSVAQGLAASGYIITAVGGNETTGFLLIGTRAQGATAPRNIQVLAGFSSIKGYAIVGLAADLTAQATTLIAEQ